MSHCAKSFRPAALASVLALLVLAGHAFNATAGAIADQPGTAGATNPDTATGAARLVITVRDSYGVVRGSSVTLVPLPGGSTRSGITDAEGRFVFDGVPVGDYRLVASFPGFADVRSDDRRSRPGRSVQST